MARRVVAPYKKAVYHRPLIRPLRGHLLSGGKAVVVGRRNTPCEKQENAPVPYIGTRARKRRFVVPPKFRAAGPLPQAPCCGGVAAPVSRPAGSAVFGRARDRGALSTQRPLSVRRDSGYSCAVMAVNGDMLPYFPQKVKAVGKSYRAKGTRLGFMPMRQSRSPRARPWMSISAVATLVARGTECSSHRREIYMTLSSMSVSLG